MAQPTAPLRPGPVVIGFAGGTACGKTTIVEDLLEGMPDERVGVVSQDAYYRDLSHRTPEQRARVNFDHPDAIDFDLLVAHVRELKAGRAIDMPVYSFHEETRTGQTLRLPPKEVVLLEGILVFTDPVLRKLMDFKVYVDADADQRLLRRFGRDWTERGHDWEKMTQRYIDQVKPMHQAYVEPSKAHADIIVPNNRRNPKAVAMLRAMVLQILETHGNQEMV